MHESARFLQSQSHTPQVNALILYILDNRHALCPLTYAYLVHQEDGRT